MNQILFYATNFALTVGVSAAIFYSTVNVKFAELNVNLQHQIKAIDEIKSSLTQSGLASHNMRLDRMEGEQLRLWDRINNMK